MTAIEIQYVSIISDEVKDKSLIKSNQSYSISSDYPYCLKY